jgi:hypothetical protein
MKTNSSFNLKKEAKREIATIVDRHKRGEYKRLCIEAQLNYDQAKRQPLKVKDKE